MLFFKKNGEKAVNFLSEKYEEILTISGVETAEYFKITAKELITIDKFGIKLGASQKATSLLRAFEKAWFIGDTQEIFTNSCIYGLCPDLSKFAEQANSENILVYADTVVTGREMAEIVGGLMSIGVKQDKIKIFSFIYGDNLFSGGGAFGNKIILKYDEDLKAEKYYFVHTTDKFFEIELFMFEKGEPYFLYENQVKDYSQRFLSIIRLANMPYSGSFPFCNCSQVGSNYEEIVKDFADKLNEYFSERGVTFSFSEIDLAENNAEIRCFSIGIKEESSFQLGVKVSFNEILGEVLIQPILVLSTLKQLEIEELLRLLPEGFSKSIRNFDLEQQVRFFANIFCESFQWKFWRITDLGELVRNFGETVGNFSSYYGNGFVGYGEITDNNFNCIVDYLKNIPKNTVKLDVQDVISEYNKMKNFGTSVFYKLSNLSDSLRICGKNEGLPFAEMVDILGENNYGWGLNEAVARGLCEITLRSVEIDGEKVIVEYFQPGDLAFTFINDFLCQTAIYAVFEIFSMYPSLKNNDYLQEKLIEIFGGKLYLLGYPKIVGLNEKNKRKAIAEALKRVIIGITVSEAVSYLGKSYNFDMNDIFVKYADVLWERRNEEITVDILLKTWAELDL